MDHNDNTQHETLKSIKRGFFGNPVGNYHHINVLMYMRQYELEFPDEIV